MPNTETMLAKVEAAEGMAASPDLMLEALDFIAMLKQATKEAEVRVKASMFRHIQANGPIINGTQKWYVAAEKETKCRDYSKTINTILEVSGGDEQRLIDCLSSNAFKHGTIKKLLKEFGQQERYGALFEVIEKDKLKEGGIAEKKLQCIDSRFVK